MRVKTGLRESALQLRSLVRFSNVQMLFKKKKSKKYSEMSENEDIKNV